MNKNIDKLVKEYIKNLKQIDTSTSPNRVVKSVDKLTQELYIALLKTKEHPNIQNRKTGHCC